MALWKNRPNTKEVECTCQDQQNIFPIQNVLHKSSSCQRPRKLSFLPPVIFYLLVGFANLFIYQVAKKSINWMVELTIRVSSYNTSLWLILIFVFRVLPSFFYCFFPPFPNVVSYGWNSSWDLWYCGVIAAYRHFFWEFVLQLIKCRPYCIFPLCTEVKSPLKEISQKSI